MCCCFFLLNRFWDENVIFIVLMLVAAIIQDVEYIVKHHKNVFVREHKKKQQLPEKWKCWVTVMWPPFDTWKWQLVAYLLCMPCLVQQWDFIIAIVMKIINLLYKRRKKAVESIQWPHSIQITLINVNAKQLQIVDMDINGFVWPRDILNLLLLLLFYSMKNKHKMTIKN